MIDPKYIQTLCDVLAQAMKDAAEASALDKAVKEILGANGNATEELMKDAAETNAPLGDQFMFYDFVNDVFDEVRDNITHECNTYTGDGKVLAGMYDVAARRVGGVPTLDDVLRTICTFKDDDEVMLLRYGIDSGNARERLVHCIMFDLLALYALDNNGVYHYAGEGDEKDVTPERPAKSRNR